MVQDDTHFLKTILIESDSIYSIDIYVYDIESMIVWQICHILCFCWSQVLLVLKSMSFGKDMVGFARLNRGGERPRDEPCEGGRWSSLSWVLEKHRISLNHQAFDLILVENLENPEIWSEWHFQKIKHSPWKIWGYMTTFFLG